MLKLTNCCPAENQDTSDGSEHQRKTLYAERSHVVSRTQIRKLQRRHFLFYTVVPGFLSLLAPFTLSYLPIGREEYIGIIFFWLLTGLGMTLGFHRLFAHRSFKTFSALRMALAITGMMAAPGPLIAWVANHRRHHSLSDQEGDPHSPNLHGSGTKGAFSGILHAHFGWMAEHELANPKYYCKDLLADPRIRWASKNYHLWVLIGIVLSGVFGFAIHSSIKGVAATVLWVGMVRLFLVQNIISAVNSFGHFVGKRSYNTPDNSRNLFMLGILALGEGWHNNHHSQQTAARLGHTWWEVDLGFYFLLALESMKLVWDIRRPKL
jgi:stearoyl-CoA desaturase (Delta-9 desaturase)